MKMKIYQDDSRMMAGMTMKDTARPEENHMGLHSCKRTEDVLENRRALADKLGAPLDTFVFGRQTHSANFRRVSKEDAGSGTDGARDAFPDTDALYTTEPGIVLCTLTADCVPVLFWNERDGVIGVIHSGWQGTVKEITPKLFDRLAEEGFDPRDFRVQIGAALSQEKFEVDRDVFDRFQALGYADDFIRFNEETGKWHIDNQKTVERQLIRAGVPAERISADRTCTFKSPDGFSYRKDKKAGRHLSFIQMKN